MSPYREEQIRLLITALWYAACYTAATIVLPAAVILTIAAVA